jgi:hypothetical protein
MTQKFTGQLTRKELDSIAPIGNSPTYMTVEDMKKVGAAGARGLRSAGLQACVWPAHTAGLCAVHVSAQQ